MITFDVETYDPHLNDSGPGYIRSGLDGKLDGRLLCVAFRDKCLWLPDDTEEIKQRLGSNEDKCGHNINYDIGWCEASGIAVNGRLHDTRIMRHVIDSSERGKLREKPEIKDWCKENKLKGDPREHIFRMPRELVSRYAVEDVTQTEMLWHDYNSTIKVQSLQKLNDLEHRLLPLVHLMFKTGIDIDKVQLEKNIIELDRKIAGMLEQFEDEFGADLSIVNSPKFGDCLIDAGYKLTEKTATGRWKLDKDTLTSVGAHLPVKIKEYQRLQAMFLIGVLGKRDRIHASLDQCGTITGRFSCHDPNMQNLPARDLYAARLVRTAIIPLGAHSGNAPHKWGQFDYSQIEYRLLAHFAYGPHGDKLREQYLDPNTDYHKIVMGLTGLKRKLAKNLNFGLMYGLGIRSAAIKYFGGDVFLARRVINQYLSDCQFLPDTIARIKHIYRQRGFIRTLYGRRAVVNPGKEYQLINRLIQSSAAEIMKQGMVSCYEAGIFDVCPPHITVHDEMNVSVPDTKIGMEAFTEMGQIMEKCVTLSVPVTTDKAMAEYWPYEDE